MTDSNRIGHNALENLLRGLKVHGSINTKQKCPVCNGKFQFDPNKLDFICRSHKTRPERYYINGKAFGLGHIYSDPKTNQVFETYSQALDVLLAINRDFKAVNNSKSKFAAKFGNTWIPEKVLENRMEQICQRWLKNHEAEAEKKAKNRVWVNQLTNSCNNFIVPFFKDRDIHDLSRDDVERFYHHLLDLGYSSKYIKEILAVLKSLFLRYRPGDTPEFPSFAIVPVREKQRLGFTREIAAVEQVPERYGYRLAILLLLRTGMRINELPALKVHDLDDGTIFVSKAISDDELRLSRKSGGEVPYSVSPELWVQLLNHIENKKPDDFVFEINGKPITTDRLYKVWAAACKKAKVKHISLQQASRHSTATEIYAEHKKRALKEIEERLGHGNTTTAIKHYIIEGREAPSTNPPRTHFEQLSRKKIQ